MTGEVRSGMKGAYDRGVIPGAEPLLPASNRLLQENEEDGEDEAGEGGQVVPLEGLALEDEKDDDREDRQGDDFLDDLQLHQVERAAVAFEADAVGRDGEAVFEEGDAPGEEDHEDERPAGRDFHFLQFQMTIPGEGHEDVGAHQHQDGPDCLHSGFSFSGRKDSDKPARLAQKLVFFLSFSKSLSFT